MPPPYAHLDKNYREEFDKRNSNLERIKSEIEKEESRLKEIKNEYATKKKNLDDLQSSGKNKVDEEIKNYKDEELSKLDKELYGKKIELKKWDDMISSKEEDFYSLVNTSFNLRERILDDIDRCNSFTKHISNQFFI